MNEVVVFENHEHKALSNGMHEPEAIGWAAYTEGSDSRHLAASTPPVI